MVRYLVILSILFLLLVLLFLLLLFFLLLLLKSLFISIIDINHVRNNLISNLSNKVIKCPPFVMCKYIVKRGRSFRGRPNAGIVLL